MERPSVHNPAATRKAPGRGPELIFRHGIMLSALAIVAMLLAIFLSLIIFSFPSIKAFGASFLWGRVWDPVSKTFGVLPFLVGTLATSFLALLISLPFSLSIAVFIGEYAREGVLSAMLKQVTELLAGIPSIIYGFWALFVMVPVVREFQIAIGVFPYGVGILSASLILSVMIIPYAASISREVIALVPADIKEAAYSLGATRQEVVTKVVLPHARSGIMAGVLLALGRALGETMAVTMVIGNSNLLPKGFFSPSNTMASVIANEFTEATAKLYLSSLVEVALVLFLVTMVINVIGRYVIKRMRVEA